MDQDQQREEIRIMEVSPSIRLQLYAASVPALLSLTLGMTLGYTGVVLPGMEEEFGGTMEDSSWIASLISLGAILGCLLGATSADRLGRKSTFAVASIAYVCGWIVVALAHEFIMVCVGRILSGIGIGLSSGSCQIYLSEISHVRLKGPFGASSIFNAGLGIVIVYILGTLLSWRIVAGLSAIFPIISCILAIWYIPESPSWLIAKGFKKEAELSFYQLRGKNYNVSSELESLFESTQKQNINKSRLNRSEVSQCFRTAIKPFSILSVLFFVQQFSGIGVAVGYAVVMIQTVVTDINSYNVTIVMGVFRLSFSLLTIFLLGRFGLRQLLITSCVIMSISTTTVGTLAYFLSKDSVSSELSNWMIIIGLMVYVCSSCVGMSPVPWVLVGEMFPLRYRGMLCCLMTCVVSTLAFTSLKLYPLALTLMENYGLFWFFGTISGLGAVFSFFVVAETRGKTLVEIEKNFSSDHGAQDTEQR